MADVILSFTRCQQNERQIPIFITQITWKISSTSLRNSNINIKKKIFSHICYSKQNFVTSPPHTTKFRLNKNMPTFFFTSIAISQLTWNILLTDWYTIRNTILRTVFEITDILFKVNKWNIFKYSKAWKKHFKNICFCGHYSFFLLSFKSKSVCLLRCLSLIKKRTLE